MVPQEGQSYHRRQFFQAVLSGLTSLVFARETPAAGEFTSDDLQSEDVARASSWWMGPVEARIELALQSGKRGWMMPSTLKWLSPTEWEALYPDGSRVRETYVRQSLAGLRAGLPTGRNSPEIWVAERTWYLAHSGWWRFAMGVEWPELASASTGSNSVPDPWQWQLPAAIINGNTVGRGDFPQGDRQEGWSLREDRLSVPSAALLWNVETGVGYAVATQPALAAAGVYEPNPALALSSVAVEGTHLRIEVPYREYPRSYRHKGSVGRGDRRGVSAWAWVASAPGSQAPAPLRRRWMWLRGEAASLAQWNEWVVRAYQQVGLYSSGNPELPKASAPSWNEVIARKKDYLRRLVITKQGLTGLIMGRHNGMIQPYYNKTAGSFLVRSLDAAALFAEDFDSEPGNLELAEKIGDTFLKGRRQEGVFQDAYDFITRRWVSFFPPSIRRDQAAGVNARANAECGLAYLRLAAALEKRGRDGTRFRIAAQEIGRFYVRMQERHRSLLQGGYGSYFRWDGEIIESQDSTNRDAHGAYVLSLQCALANLPGWDETQSLLDAFLRYRNLALQGNWGAGTLDASCLDKEGGLAFLAAFLDVFNWAQVRGDARTAKQALEVACESARYVLNWVWQYSVAFDPRSSLGREAFETRGMTSVSVAHPHMDFYGPAVAVEFLRLVDALKDSVEGEFWLKEARQILEASRQLLQPDGHQPEQIFYTRWSFLPGLRSPKGKYGTEIAWVGVLTLDALLKARAWGECQDQ